MAIFRRAVAKTATQPAIPGSRREIAIPPRPAVSPAVVDPPDALALPTAFRCVQLTAHTVGNLPVTIRQGDQRVPSPQWLRHPQSFGSPSLRHMIAGLVADMALFGSGYLQAEPVGVSWRLSLIPANSVGVSFDSRGRRIYRVAGQPAALLDPGSEITRARGGLIPVPFLILPGCAAPLGPIQAARMALGGYVDTDAYAARVFRSGRGHTGGRLETDQDIMPDAAARYRDDWLAAQSDPHDSKIPVLGAGLKFATDSIDPRDAQWIESRGYNSAEIARLFGVPPRYLGLPSGDSVTYATARDNDAAWIRTSLAPYISEIEAALSMLLPFGRTDSEDQRAVLNTEALLRSTTEDRWQAYTVGLSAGFLTVDEVRRSEGMPPLEQQPEPAEPVSPGVIA